VQHMKAGDNTVCGCEVFDLTLHTECFSRVVSLASYLERVSLF
jgi:hypothetical protein